MENIPMLTILGLLPLVGALIAFGVKGRSGRNIACGFSLVTLAWGLVVFGLSASDDLAETVAWIPQIGAHYALGLDGMGRAMVLLTVILTPLVIAFEWNNDSAVLGAHMPGRWSPNVFAALTLLVEAFALYVFMASDVLLFYLFFEGSLIPLFLMVLGWGGARRRAAALKFLLYSLAGGLVMLVALVGVYAATAQTGSPSFLVSDIAAAPIDEGLARWLFVGFFFAFAVKAPMVPVHTWLPDTAEQATPGTSTMLVGVLDKIGTFGMIKFCLGLFGEASQWAAPAIIILAVISIFYGAFMAITSKNLLRLVAYTSVSHFGFMVLGIFAFTTTSIAGSILYMLAHGFSSAAMFFAVGFLVNRRGSAEIADFGGVQQLAPVLAGTFLVAGLATLGLPGTANFAGEFSIMVGAFPVAPAAVFVAVVATVLAGLYVLWAYQRVFTGEPSEVVRQKVNRDLDGRERAVIGVLIALLLGFGLIPNLGSGFSENTASATMSQLGIDDPVNGSIGGK